MRLAPIERRHVREGYVALLKAAHRGDWREVERLHSKMPATYRAVSALLVFATRFRAS